MTKLVFLGTAGMVPTKERNVQSLYLEYEGEGILLDCGEGTQRQLQLAGLNAQKITTILISHWHGDHVIGLLGLLQTINSFAPEGKTIKLFGPKGTTQYFEHMIASTVFELTLNVNITELEAQELTTFFETPEYQLQAVLLDHGTPCLGYRFTKKERRSIEKKKLPSGLKGPLVGELQEGKTITYNGETINPDDVSFIQPARSIAFVFDTKYCPACEVLAKDAEVLVTESSLTHDLLAKAEEFQHLTAYQAGLLAKNAGAEHLILTHFSQRYKDVSLLENDAKRAFQNVLCAEDFLEIEFDF